MNSGVGTGSCPFLKKKKTLIYLFRLHWVLVAAWDLFSVTTCGLLSCGMRTLSCSMHVGSSSPTRNRTQGACIGSAKSYPLHHQGSPRELPFLIIIPLWFSLPFHSRNSSVHLCSLGLCTQGPQEGLEPCIWQSEGTDSFPQGNGNQQSCQS